MTNFKIALIVASGYFAFFGVWPFASNVHGDGSTTTRVDYFVHATGIVVFVFVILQLIVALCNEDGPRERTPRETSWKQYFEGWGWRR